MSSQADIATRWVAYNLDGKGKADSAPSSLWYRGDVLFAHTMPVMRIVRGYRDHPVCLGLGYNYVGNKSLMTLITVKCLGVFSHYAGDMLPLEQLHKRQEWLYQQEYMERITDWKVGTTHAEIAANPDRLVNSRINMIKTVLDKRVLYTRNFGIAWQGLPDAETYRSEFAEYFHGIADKYNSAREVERRAREAGRRAARKAFLDEEKKR